MEWIETLQAYAEKRYRGLETSLLERAGARMGKEFRKIREECLSQWEKALQEALEVQAQEGKPCAYMSISLLNTSLMAGRPRLQIDFYNEEWVYGSPWHRSRMPADFLFREWEAFQAEALDGAFYVRSRLPKAAIRSLFWETADRLAYLFACFAKYFAPGLSELPAFQALRKAPVMYVTCGTYLDWQERVYAILPAIDLLDPAANEETAFREFRGQAYREHAFQGMDLRHCRFYGCSFDQVVFSRTNLSDALFRDCTFRQVDFVEARLAGCVWEGCRLLSCRFQQSGTQPDGDEYFAEAEMVRSRFHGLQIIGCDFSRFLLRDSSGKDVSIEATALESSGWKPYAGAAGA